MQIIGHQSPQLIVNISLHSTSVANIPVLTLIQNGAKACPVVFYVPGYGGTKESGLNLGYQLARQGFFVVSFDPLWHGERFDERLFNPQPALYPPDTGLA